MSPIRPLKATTAKRSNLRITKARLGSFLCENVGREVDLSALQLLGRALGNLAIHPKGESLDFTAALRQLTESLDARGSVLAPNRIVARERYDQDALRVHRADPVVLAA